MASVTLVHPEETLTVSLLQAITKCGLFQTNPALAAIPYALHSSVPLALFRQFVSALAGNPIEVTSANFSGLSRLSDEFGLTDLRSKLSESPPLQEAEDAEARARIAALEGWAHRRDCNIADFERKFTRLEMHFGRLRSDISALKAALDALPAVARAPPAIQPSPVIFPLLAPAPSLSSLIVPDFPEIFAEFRGKRFQNLWRGGRDGFGADAFHGRCDGHANTLTVILDTDGNIFGGFTPVEWESLVWNGKRGDENNCWKADHSLKSFLFTLKNPHNIAARRFALNAENKKRAICCDSGWGPCFRISACDIAVGTNCNAGMHNYTYFGSNSINQTRLDGKAFFTGSRHFQVKEIEVFEITG
jgi:hypothetical protein